MVELSRGDACVTEDDFPSWSKELTLVESYLEKAHFKGLCGDSVIVDATPNFEHIDLTCIESLNLKPISPPLVPTPLSFSCIS